MISLRKAAGDAGHGIAAREVCGNVPDLWLNLRKRYDLQRAEEELGEKIKAIPTPEVA